MTESARDRFMRNHAENVRIMRARATQLEADGMTEEAQQVREIADAWDAIADKAGEGPEVARG